MQLTIEEEMDNIRKGIMEHNQLSVENSITNDKKLIELESNESYSDRLSGAISYAIHNAPEDMTQAELQTIDEAIQEMGADVSDPKQIRIGADLLPLIRSGTITQEETSVVFGSDKSNARMESCAELLSAIAETRINGNPYNKMQLQELTDICFNNAEIKAFGEAIKDGRDPMVIAKGTEADKLYNLFVPDKRAALVQASYMENMTVPKFMVCLNPDFSADQIMQVAKAFKAGLSLDVVEKFAKPEFDVSVMKSISSSLTDIPADRRSKAAEYISDKYTMVQLTAILQCFMDSDIDVHDIERIANPKFQPQTIKSLRIACQYHELKDTVLKIAEQGGGADVIDNYRHRYEIYKFKERKEKIQSEVKTLTEKSKSGTLSEKEVHRLETAPHVLTVIDESIAELEDISHPVDKTYPVNLRSKVDHLIEGLKESRAGENHAPVQSSYKGPNR